VPVLEPSVEITPSMVTASTVHHLIVFSSAATSPFAGLLSNKVFKYGYDPEEYVQLFAVSTDGNRAGSLGGSVTSFLPLFPSKFYAAVLAIQYSSRLDTSRFPLSRLPAECYYPLDDVPMPCFQFQFSPDGNYIGYRYGTDMSRADLRILETQTGKMVFSSKDGGNHWYLFTPDNRVLMAFGHAEGGSISLYDPLILRERSLGPESAQETMSWNHDYQAFVVYLHDYQGMNSQIWGYNLFSDKVFLSDEGVIEAYTWTPDGSNVLYQKSDIVYVSQPDLTTTYSVVRLMLAPITGKPRPFLGHYNYDFHLCYGLDEPCEWFGNWYPIRRIQASEREVSSDGRDDCLSYGIDCPNPAEHFLVNWRTGNLVPPDYKLPQTPTATTIPSSTPTVAPIPTPIPGPDLARQPVYAPPSGAYAFYVGLDGSSLWLVPKAGDAVLWVADGENFIYVP
jgi:hypothetical protein